MQTSEIASENSNVWNAENEKCKTECESVLNAEYEKCEK